MASKRSGKASSGSRPGRTLAYAPHVFFAETRPVALQAWRHDDRVQTTEA